MNEPVELDEAARDLIAAGREGVAPNDFVAERVRRSVERTLQGAAPPSRSRRRIAPVLVALGAAALGGALYASQLLLAVDGRDAPPRPAPSATPVAPVPSAAVPTPAPVRSPEPPALVAVPASSGQGPSAGRAEPSKPSRSQQLGSEIELLARVNGAVNAGDGGRALALLDEYDRKFRPSILGEERAAASVLALCAAGRHAEARAAAERFGRRWPRSPLSGRIAGSCAGAR